MPLAVDPDLLLAAFPPGSWIEDSAGNLLAGVRSEGSFGSHDLGGAVVRVPGDHLRNEERYRNFIERSHEGIWRFELQPPIPVDLPVAEQVRLAFERATLAECNDALARMAGVERAEELLGLPLASIIDPDDPGNVAHLQTFVENGYILEEGESEQTGVDGARGVFINNILGVVENGCLVRAWGVQREITEERRNERLFRNIAEATPDLLCIYDVWDRRTEFVNQRVEDILGWTPEEFIELTAGASPSLVHPSDIPAMEPGMRANAALKVGEVRQTTYRLRHKNGSYRTLDYRMIAFEAAADGSPLRLLIIGRDLTALRAEGRDFRQAVEGMAHLVWSTGQEGFPNFFNHQWKDFIGFDPNQMGESEMWERLLHPDDQARAGKTWERCLATGEPYEIEFRFRRYDGAYRWFLARALPIRDEDGRIVRWFGTCTDIHAQRVALESLARESSRLRLALETLGAGAWRYDIPSGHVEWSDEMYAIQNVPRDTADLYRVSLDRMHPEDRERFKANMRACFGGRRSFRQDARVELGAKGERWMRIRATVVDGPDGQPESVVGLVQDVTEEKQNEEALERAVAERTRELERANRELEGFSYSVSHDLRAPLRAIIANSRMLLDDAPPELSQEHKTMLERQATNAKRLGDLIDDLLRLSRVSRQDMRHEPLDMSAMAQEVADEIEAREPGRVRFEIQPAMRAHGDSRLLRFVWLNLLENAAKFSPPGGFIVVGQDEKGFFVRDQGIGFDPEYAHKLFQPFERLVRDDQFPGTGIGLANVKRIVERHSGEVSAEGRPGEGATFRFTLPEEA